MSWWLSTKHAVLPQLLVWLGFQSLGVLNDLRQDLRWMVCMCIFRQPRFFSLSCQR